MEVWSTAPFIANGRGADTTYMHEQLWDRRPFDADMQRRCHVQVARKVVRLQIATLRRLVLVGFEGGINRG